MPAAASNPKRRRANGEGSLVLRKDGRWMGRYWLTLPDGTKKQQSIISKNKAKVIAKLRDEIIMADKGAPMLRDGRATGEYLEYWLKYIDPHQVRPSTLQLHTIITRKYLIPLLGRIPLTQLRPEHIRMMLGRMKTNGCGDRTMQHARNVLSAALREALKLEYVTRNAARLVDLPKYTPKERRVWTKEQAAHFLEAAQHHERFPMFLLLLCYGLRRGELLGLRWQDIDFDNNIIRIRQSLKLVNNKAVIGELKTRASRRDLPMPPTIKETLLQYKQTCPHYDDGLIFHSDTGNPVWPNTIRKTFQTLARQAELPPITIHEARHTVATLLAEAWRSPKEAQAILGHGSIMTTLQIYTHANPQLQEKAVIALLQNVF